MIESRVDYLMEKYKGRKVYKVRSFSRPDEWHFVYYQHDKWNCSCEVQMYHPSRICDHIRKARHQKMKVHGRKNTLKK